MMRRIIIVICGVFASISLMAEKRSQPLSMQESLQNSLEAAGVFRTLEQAGGSSQRSDGLKNVFACMHALAHRVSCADRMPLTRTEFAELLVDLAESVEYVGQRDATDLSTDQSTDSSSSVDDGMPSAEEQLGQTLLQQLYAEPNHQERVGVVEKILNMSDKLEGFFIALFNKVSSVVSGTVSAIQQTLVGTLNGAAQLLGFDSASAIIDKIGQVASSALNAAGNLASNTLHGAESLGTGLINAAENATTGAVNLAQSSASFVTAEVQVGIQTAETALSGMIQSVENAASSVTQTVEQGAQSAWNAVQQGVSSVTSSSDSSSSDDTSQGVDGVIISSNDVTDASADSSSTDDSSADTSANVSDASTDDSSTGDNFNGVDSIIIIDEVLDNSGSQEICEIIIAPLSTQEALLIRAVLNFDQQEVLARSVLVTPDYSAEVNVGFAPFVNSLCHQVKRAGLQNKMGEYVRALCEAGSDAKREEKLYRFLADKKQSEEMCKEVIATAGALVVDQALVSLSSLKDALKTVAISLQ